jgi:hypothetical protein
MRETRHILSHRRSGNTLELTLDEASGTYIIRQVTVYESDEGFLCDLRRWVRAIGRGWQKRNSQRFANVPGLSNPEKTYRAKKGEAVNHGLCRFVMPLRRSMLSVLCRGIVSSIRNAKADILPEWAG